MKNILLLALVAVAGAASAAPIVSVTVTGTSGDYTYDFSINNTLGDANNIGFFGVVLGANHVVGIPEGFAFFGDGSWNQNATFGGSSTKYDNVWKDETWSTLKPGSTLGGFRVYSILPLATDIKWFAFAYGGYYHGSDHFGSPNFPLFEGTVNAVPEPASMVALGAGALALVRRRKKA
ncbi:MAG: PEP-CTERM sorting domain-containing protein [Fimbriimonas sp.]